MATVATVGCSDLKWDVPLTERFHLCTWGRKLSLLCFPFVGDAISVKSGDGGMTMVGWKETAALYKREGQLRWASRQASECGKVSTNYFPVISDQTASGVLIFIISITHVLLFECLCGTSVLLVLLKRRIVIKALWPSNLTSYEFPFLMWLCPTATPPVPQSQSVLSSFINTGIQPSSSQRSHPELQPEFSERSLFFQSHRLALHCGD